MRFNGPFLPFIFLVTTLFACNNQAIGPNPVQAVKTAETAHDPFNRRGHLIYTRHARCRMDCRHITKQEIAEVLDSGIIDYRKSEPDSKPDPKYAVEAYTTEHQHLRIVVAPSGDNLIVITCIELGVEWQCNCN